MKLLLVLICCLCCEPVLSGIRKRLTANEAGPAADREVPRDVGARGVRQRFGTDSAAVGSSSPSASSSRTAAQPILPLVESLKRDWAKGVINAVQVQDYAAGAEAQGAIGVDPLSSAGAYGVHKSSIHRALINLFGRPRGAPAITYIEIPTKRGRKTPHPFISFFKVSGTIGEIALKNTFRDQMDLHRNTGTT